jgi:hypothetical protein
MVVSTTTIVLGNVASACCAILQPIEGCVKNAG